MIADISRVRLENFVRVLEGVGDLHGTRNSVPFSLLQYALEELHQLILALVDMPRTAPENDAKALGAASSGEKVRGG